MGGFGPSSGEITWKGQKFSNFDQFYEWLKAHPEEIPEVYPHMPANIRALFDAYQKYEQFEAGQASANDVLQEVGQSGLQIDPTLEKSLDNSIARENTSNDQQFQEHMRDTSLTSSGDQLAALGLSRSGVIQVGGASSGVSSAAATNNMHSAASIYQRERINNFNQNLGIAKSIMSLVGSMASSGIYGHAIGAAKQAGSALAAATAHSGIKAMTALNQGKFRKNEFGKYPNDKVGGFYSIFE